MLQRINLLPLAFYLRLCDTGNMSEDLDPRSQLDIRNPRILHREVFYSGKRIIEQGEEGFRAYYIESGQAEVLIKDGPHELKVAELGPGDLFGEMALINNEPRSASVRAITDCTLTVISREEIEGKISIIEDKAIRALINVLVDRLREATRGQMVHFKNLADFQDRIHGIIDRVELGVSEQKRGEFRKEVEPLLSDLEKVLDRFRRI